MTIEPTHEDIGSLVPADEKPEAPDFFVGKHLTAYLFKMRDQALKLNESEWLEAKRNMVRSRSYFDDRQYGTVNDNCQWVDFEKRPGEINYTNNIYTGHIMTALMELSRGRTEFSFTHISPDSRTGQMVARVAEERARTHRKRLFPALRLQHENLSLLLNGLALRYTYFNYGYRSEKMPIIGKRETTDSEVKVCSICYKKIDGECPNCGNSDAVDLKAGSGYAKVIEGYEDKKCGENDWCSVDPLGVTFYIHAATLDDSPFIIWKQAILHDVLQNQYPDVQIQEGINSTELRYKMDRSANSVSGQMEGTSSNESEFCQGWFDISLYENQVLQADIKLRNGTVIPGGTKLGKAFPLGMYMAWNGDRLLDLWNENKKDKWSAAPYGTRLGTLVGGGTVLALSNQDIVNDLRNLEMASAMNDAFRKEFVNSQYIEPENIPDDPRERAVITNMPDGGKIVGSAIDVLPGSALSGDVYALEEKIAGTMQQQLGTFSGTQVGAPDLKAVQDTASGMAMWRDMAVGRYAPMLAVRSDCLDKEQIYQFLVNDQKYLSSEQWDKIKSEYGDESVKAFLKADLRKELIIEVIPESYMPESRSQRITNVMGYGRMLTESQIPPNSEMGAYIANQFGIPKNIVGFDAHYSAAMNMVYAFRDQAQPIVEQFGDVPTCDLNDPVVLQLAELVVTQANVPVSALMDDAPAMENALRDWWAKDEGRMAPNLLKSAVMYRVLEIKGEVVTAAQMEQAMQIEANAPMQAVQRMEQEEAMAAQAEQQAMQAEQQNLATDQQRLDSAIMDEESRLRDDEKVLREADEKERDHQRAIELALLNKQREG